LCRDLGLDVAQLGVRLLQLIIQSREFSVAQCDLTRQLRKLLLQVGVLLLRRVHVAVDAVAGGGGAGDSRFNLAALIGQLRKLPLQRCSSFAPRPRRR
jgi:hypothetical protein